MDEDMGTSSSEYSNGIAVDGSGNVYVTGFTEGGLDGNVSSGGKDIFLVKYDTSGNKLWTRQTGTAGTDVASDAAADAGGNVYICGYTSGSLDGASAVHRRLRMEYDSTECNSSLPVGYFGGSSVTPLQSIIKAYICGETGGNSYDKGKSFIAKFPTNAVCVNNNNSFTTNASVTLTFFVYDKSGVTDMRISNDGVFDDEPWEAYSAARAWTLTGGDGLKTVYAQFRDTLGNLSAISSSDITLDTATPTSTITSPAGGSLIGIDNFIITGTASDTGSGLNKVEVSTDGGATWNLATGTTSWSYTWTIPAAGGHTIISRATDNAGMVRLRAGISWRWWPVSAR
jgi:hypothetical protein